MHSCRIVAMFLLPFIPIQLPPFDWWSVAENQGTDSDSDDESEEEDDDDMAVSQVCQFMTHLFSI